MSSFSNANTGDKTADPYTAKNQETQSSADKVKELSAFVDKCKFCMMTTTSKEGVLASRCMALADKVRTAWTIHFRPF